MDKTYRHSVTGAERRSSRILGYPWAEVAGDSKAKGKGKGKAAPATDPDTGTRQVEDTSGDEAVENG